LMKKHDFARWNEYFGIIMKVKKTVENEDFF